MIIKPMCGSYPDALFCKAHGIVGRWLFNEKGNGINNIVSNKRGSLSGFNHNSSSGWTRTKYGIGLKFDGSDDYVNTSTASITKSEITLLAWVNIAAFGLYDGIVVQREGTTGKTIYMGLRETGRLTFFIDTNGSGSCTHDNQGSVLSGNTWYMVGFTFSSITNALVTYVNGQVNSTATGSISGGLLPVIPDSWEFGNDKGAAGRYLSGIIDQVIISNKILPQKTIESFNRNPWCGLISSTQFQSESSQMAAIGAD